VQSCVPIELGRGCTIDPGVILDTLRDARSRGRRCASEMALKCAPEL